MRKVANRMFTKSISQISKKDVTIAGGKGASLGKLSKAGILVPPGFVLLSSAYDRFIRDNNLGEDIEKKLKRIKRPDSNSVEQASEKIREAILSGVMPRSVSKEIQNKFKLLKMKYVAVRSSATSEDSSNAAWAGQLETYLNTTEPNLEENIMRCWASLFTSRAIFYRFEKDLQKKPISVAVIVQEMVQSDISGVAFSVHPVTKNYDSIIIEAGYGLGEAVVSGWVTPDTYIVKKEGLKIEQLDISSQNKMLVGAPEGNEWKIVPTGKQLKQKLTPPQILELSRLVIKIEQHYGFPCDIEWAKRGTTFYITQSRPITTLQASSPLPKQVRR